MGRFDEAEYRRDTSGKFSHKDQSEAAVSLDGDGRVWDAGSADLVRERQGRLESRFASSLRDLNANRLLLSVDETLPGGVVRCTDCGRFVSEAEPGHVCPFPKFTDAGFSADLARRLAHAGFNRPYEAVTWRTAIEAIGSERAGLYKAIGVGPFEARRLEREGFDPADVYPREYQSLEDAVSETAERLEEWTRYGTLFNTLGGQSLPGMGPVDSLVMLDGQVMIRRASGECEPLCVTDSEVIEDVVALGHRVAAEIDSDERLAAARARLAADREVLTEDRNVLKEPIEDALGQSGMDGLTGAFIGSVQRGQSPGEIAEQYREAYKAVRPMAQKYLAVEAELDRLPSQRAAATIEVLSELRPFGGDLAADLTRGSKPIVEDAVVRLPSGWLAASAEHQTDLRVELGSGRAHYRHEHIKRSTSQRSVRETPIDTTRTAWGGAWHGIGEPSAEWMEGQLRRAHPEAFDSDEYVRIGKSRKKRDRSRSRVRNISNIRWENGQIRFGCEFEEARLEYNRSHSRTSLIKTDRSVRATVHELGHRFENTMPEVKRLATAWRAQRTSHGDRDRVNTGMPGEWGYEGDFVDRYVGKEYRSGDTEVVSMGLESVLTGSHGGLVGDGNHDRADHDHRAFMLGLLAAAGRR